MKKVLSATLCSLMLFTSSIGFASDDAWKENLGTIDLDAMTVSGSGVEIDGTTIRITAGGDFTVTGTLSSGQIYVNSEEKVKLRLSGADITCPNGPAIYFDNAEKAFITITEGTKNVLTDSAEYAVEDADAALFSNDDLEIKGDGELTVNGNYQHGIASDDDIKIENGTITVNSYEHGIKANDKVEILGGELNITAETGKGIKAGTEFIATDGDVKIYAKAHEGLESKGTLTIDGGNFDITAADDGINTGNEDTTDTTGEAFIPERNADGTMPQRPDGTAENQWRQRPMTMPEGMTPPEGITMPDGTMQSYPTEGVALGGKRIPQHNGAVPPDADISSDGQMTAPIQNMGGRGAMFGGGFGPVDEETAAAHAITINGGTITIRTEGDGIDSNGNLFINGGTVTVHGPTRSGNGPIDSQGSFEINGGTVITLSSVGMLQLPQSTEGLNILRVSFEETVKAGSEVEIKDSEGNELLKVTAEKDSQALIFASDKLAAGSSVTVYTDGAEKYTVSLTDGITTAGNASGGRNGGFGMGSTGDNRGGFGNRINRNEVSVTVDGRRLQFDTAPVIKDGTTLVGYRAIMEALGAEVTWDEETQTVTAAKDDTTIVLTIGSKKAKVNGEEKDLLQAPEIISDSTMVPVRFISEQVGRTVNWHEEFNLVEIR